MISAKGLTDKKAVTAWPRGHYCESNFGLNYKIDTQFSAKKTNRLVLSILRKSRL